MPILLEIAAAFVPLLKLYLAIGVALLVLCHVCLPFYWLRRI